MDRPPQGTPLRAGSRERLAGHSDEQESRDRTRGEEPHDVPTERQKPDPHRRRPLRQEGVRLVARRPAPAPATHELADPQEDRGEQRQDRGRDEEPARDGVTLATERRRRAGRKNPEVTRCEGVPHDERAIAAEGAPEAAADGYLDLVEAAVRRVGSRH